MNRLPLLALAALLAASCGSPGPEASAGASGAAGDFRTRADLDRYSGKDVVVEGTFDHLHAKHGKVTLSSGLVIYIPHFDHFQRGDAWLRYVGHRVRVEGILHTYTSGEADFSGPAIDIRHFEALDLTE